MKLENFTLTATAQELLDAGVKLELLRCASCGKLAPITVGVLEPDAEKYFKTLYSYKVGKSQKSLRLLAYGSVFTETMSYLLIDDGAAKEPSLARGRLSPLNYGFSISASSYTETKTGRALCTEPCLSAFKEQFTNYFGAKLATAPLFQPVTPPDLNPVPCESLLLNVASFGKNLNARGPHCEIFIEVIAD